MIAIWMAYGLALGLLFGLAAHALERVARLWEMPSRFVWAAAVLASLLVPLIPLLLPRAPAALEVALQSEPTLHPAVPAAPVRVAPAVAASLAWNRAGPWVAALNRPLVFLWCATSLVFALGLLRAGVRLRRRARGWRAAAVDGMPVLIAPDMGPAVVRLGGFNIVLPDWALSAEPTARSLMLRHETEHCRARDPDLLLGATLALVLTPWNLVLWWQLRRLQLAVEADCDRRVMRAGADARVYGSLLLSVGAREARRPFLAATAFSEVPSLLERRIRAMTSPRPRNPAPRVAFGIGTAVLIVAVAAMMPQPARSRAPQPTAAGQRQDTGQFDVTLRVRSTVLGQEVRFKAAFLVDDHAGLQFVDTTTPFRAAGRTHGATAILEKVGGAAQLDAALIRGTGSDTLKVSEASGPRLVVRYQPREALIALIPGGAASGLQPAVAQPTRAPREVPPGVYREEDVTIRPERVSGPAPRYPDILRMAGIDGQVLVEFIVDTTGHVEPGSVVILSSTHPEFEAPTRDAIGASTFRPGLVQGRAVRVLVRQPVNFQVARGPASAVQPPASDSLLRAGVQALQAQDWPRADTLLGLAQQRDTGQALQTAMFYHGVAQFQRGYAAVADAQSKQRDAPTDPAVKAAACASVTSAGDFLKQAEPNITGGAATNRDLASQLVSYLPHMKAALPQLGRTLNCPS